MAATLNPRYRRVGVMTAGGDAPGMNACVRAVARTCMGFGAEVFGIRRAYAGLINGDIRQLGPRDVGGIIQKGGTVLQTARLPGFKEHAVQREALRRLNEHDIEALVVIGGDGSLNGAMALQRLDFPVVGIPASIDNDIYGTNMAIGVDTALNTILEVIDKLRDTASSHQRAFLVETMGRDNGYLALMAGITGGAELVHIPEVSMSIEEIAERVEHAYIRGKTHCIIIVSEGAEHSPDEIVKHLAQHHGGFEVRVTILGHMQRGGRPSHFDRLLATRFGVAAVEALMAGRTGIMVGLDGRKLQEISLEEVVSTPRKVNLEYVEMAKMLAR